MLDFCKGYSTAIISFETDKEPGDYFLQLFCKIFIFVVDIVEIFKGVMLDLICFFSIICDPQSKLCTKMYIHLFLQKWYSVK